MPLERGTLILTTVTARLKDTGQLIETTVEEEAKKSGVHEPTRKYEPKLVAVGDGWVLKGLDEALLPANPGDKLNVEVPPEKGFGQRDPNKVKMIPLRKFGDKAEEIRVGIEVEVDNRIGIVRAIGSGRAQVDFNHKFAGKVMAYDLEIVKKLETDAEKAMALIRRRLPLEEEKLKPVFDGDTLTIGLPPEVYLLEGLQIIKRAVSSDIFRYLKNISKVYFEELYERAEPVKEEVRSGEVEKGEKKEEQTPQAKQEAEVATPTG